MARAATQTCTVLPTLTSRPCLLRTTTMGVELQPMITDRQMSNSLISRVTSTTPCRHSSSRSHRLRTTMVRRRPPTIDLKCSRAVTLLVVEIGQTSTTLNRDQTSDCLSSMNQILNRPYPIIKDLSTISRWEPMSLSLPLKSGHTISYLTRD